jgi:hypothetical protein
MMINKIVLSFLMAGTALSLAACEKTRQQFDFSKKAPDEFAVTTRAPLEMPPDFNTRVTPQPGAPRPQELSTDRMAREAVLGPDAVKNIARQNSVSQGEAVLLQRTGAANANAAIRGVVDQETAAIAKEEMPGIDHLKKMIGQNVEAPSKVVDPVAETNRIKANKAQGKPVTEGKTPTKED